MSFIVAGSKCNMPRVGNRVVLWEGDLGGGGSGVEKSAGKVRWVMEEVCGSWGGRQRSGRNGIPRPAVLCVTRERGAVRVPCYKVEWVSGSGQRQLEALGRWVAQNAGVYLFRLHELRVAGSILRSPMYDALVPTPRD